MKKIGCLLLILMLIVSSAVAETNKQLPQKDEEGRTTYVGDVGWLFDENGNAILESLFDESVLWIEEIPGVYDACITVEEGKYYNKINIAIVTDKMLSVEEAKDIADSAARNVGNCFSLSGKYEGPSQNSFGGIFDEYGLLIGVFSKSGKQIVMGAAVAGAHHFTWAK